MVLHIEMTNCFGIKQLMQDFDYNGKFTHLIYAPNGTMKTSFAKTMRFISKQSKTKPCDLLYPEDAAHDGTYSITIDGAPIDSKRLFVANGDEDIDSSKAFANFLASTDLKSRYDEIYSHLTEKKNALMSKLNTVSRSSDCESELLSTFRISSEDTIFTVLEKLATEVVDNMPSFDFKYNDVFDKKEKVKVFVSNNRDKLQTYFNQFNQLINTSAIFRTHNGHTFGTYQATQLEKSLSDGGFFGVEHQIFLHGQAAPITSSDQFSTVIKNERERILNDRDLRNIFEEITAVIEKNAELRDLKVILDSHPDWIVELLDYEEFRKKVWKGHLSKPELRALLNDYNNVYQAHKADLIAVLQESNNEQSRWKEIIDIYNDRFDVPFKIEIENQRDVILKQEAANLKFLYKDGLGNDIEQNKANLLNNILSRGEKRAFFILQLLFELEARKEAAFSSLIVLDDISDSFDYQNKYAIIEYIKDLSEKQPGKFFILVLTHNFDFYRTLASRLNLFQQNLWMVNRKSDGVVELNDGQYKGNVFVNAFVGHDDDDKIFISMIPYVRNLIEYTSGEGCLEYGKLTECLHQKTNTHAITISDIVGIMARYTQGNGMLRPASTDKVYDLIISTADSIASEANPDPVIIQNKIVLSIACRHLAEKYMHDRLIASGKTEDNLLCSGNQTGKWTQLYKNTLPNDSKRRVIERVNMMTPELIHLNSFMYEPLIDLSLNHLISLYNDCKTL